jgi:uroporphyrinogen-III synthase
MKVALTQSEGRLDGLAGALERAGHEVVRQPLVQTVPLLDAATQGRAKALLEADWLLFTSGAAVTAWQGLGLPLKGPRPRLGAVGESTAKLIERCSGKVALVGEPPHAKGLADCFLKKVKDARLVGLPRGERGLPTLGERLEGAGIKTLAVTLYRTETLVWHAGEVDAVLLASPSAAEALPPHIDGRARLISLGPSTTKAIRARGWRCLEVARPDVENVLGAVVSLENQQ